MELECLEGAVRRVDEPQVGDAFASVDWALARSSSMEQSGDP